MTDTAQELSRLARQLRPAGVEVHGVVTEVVPDRRTVVSRWFAAMATVPFSVIPLGIDAEDLSRRWWELCDELKIFADGPDGRRCLLSAEGYALPWVEIEVPDRAPLTIHAGPRPDEPSLIVFDRHHRVLLGLDTEEDGHRVFVARVEEGRIINGR